MNCMYTVLIKTRGTGYRCLDLEFGNREDKERYREDKRGNLGLNVRATVAVEKHYVMNNLSLCICSLRYPACSAHAPCYHLWPAPL
jgi:hypothetical protein